MFSSLMVFCSKDYIFAHAAPRRTISFSQCHRPLNGPFRGAVFHHCRVLENSPLALMGRFPSLMGRFPECLSGPISLLKPLGNPPHCEKALSLKRFLIFSVFFTCRSSKMPPLFRELRGCKIPSTFQGQISAQGILQLQNPNLGPSSGKQILDARTLDPNSWVDFFDPVFPSKI